MPTPLDPADWTPWAAAPGGASHGAPEAVPEAERGEALGAGPAPTPTETTDEEAALAAATIGTSSADPETEPADAPPGATPAPMDHAALGSWVRVLSGAVLFALALRVLAFEAYRIPSTSMEDTLLVGDFVLVSKLHYGPRVLGRRLPGLDGVDRGDVMVFNYPPGLSPEVSGRVPYIKRVVGLPGDTVRIQAKEVDAGGVAVPRPRNGRRLWTLEGRLPSSEALAALGLDGRVQRAGAGVWVASATPGEAEALATIDGVDGVAPYVRPSGDGSASFPSARRYSLDDYGPVVVPQAGRTVRLDDRNWPVVRTLIERFEGHVAERGAQGFLIDGRPAETYTFAQDYYFVLGDSRDDSADSRTWGFVPADHLIGKAVGVYFSWDDEAGRPRWARIGQGVGG